MLYLSNCPVPRMRFVNVGSELSPVRSSLGLALLIAGSDGDAVNLSHCFPVILVRSRGRGGDKARGQQEEGRKEARYVLGMSCCERRASWKAGREGGKIRVSGEMGEDEGNLTSLLLPFPSSLPPFLAR